MSPDAPQLQQKLSDFASRAGDVAPNCDSEATTKSYLIAPYLHDILGYNPFNPDHCVPEFSADIKGSGDKVDYALLHNGQPIIIVEAKSIGSIRPNHARPGQLNGYFVGCEAKFAALTDGLVWNWYRARTKHYELEDEPFLSHDVRSPSPIELDWLLSIVNQAKFDPNQADREALAVKLKAAFLHWLHKTRENPSDEFLTFLTKETHSEDADIELVRPIFVNAFNSLFLDKPPIIKPRPISRTDPNSPTLVLEDGTQLRSSQWQRAWRPPGSPWIRTKSQRQLYIDIVQHLSTLHVGGPRDFFSSAKWSDGTPAFYPATDFEKHPSANSGFFKFNSDPELWGWCGRQASNNRIVLTHLASLVQTQDATPIRISFLRTNDEHAINPGPEIQAWCPAKTD